MHSLILQSLDLPPRPLARPLLRELSYCRIDHLSLWEDHSRYKTKVGTWDEGGSSLMSSQCFLSSPSLGLFLPWISGVA